MNHEEESNAMALMDWCNLQVCVWPELARLIHIPNGGARPSKFVYNKALKKVERVSVEGSKLKRMGVKPGVPDYFLPVIRLYEGYWRAGLWIELKSSAGRESPDQKDWREWLANNGHIHVLCRDWIAARDVLIEYLNLETAQRGEILWRQ